MFNELKQKVRENFDKMAKDPHLFYVTVDRDKVWELYLSGFEDSEERQHHNCNACKSFLRQYAGIVAIRDNKVVSIWDDIEVLGFEKSVQNLKRYIHSLPITDVFYNEFKKCGTDKNFDMVRQVEWTHFYIELPDKFIVKRDIATKRGEKRTNKETLKRALDEISIETVETVLDLIRQNSLYRGKEHENVLAAFLETKLEYVTIPAELRDNYCWVTSMTHRHITSIRNSVIGTLLVDLDETSDLDGAVTRYERKVAPANYKRPTALATPRMIEEAKKKLEELGLMNSLERRYATERDLSVEDIFFTDKSSSVTDVFKEMSKGTLVNPKSFSKVEEVGIEDFIAKILPTAKVVELLVENPHLANLVSLVTSKEKNAKSLFKWGNNFSWSYTGGITDSIKERVKAAGGDVSGVLRFSIQWNEDGSSIVDLDAHAMEPGKSGEHIYFADYNGKKTPSSGMLDVDMIRPSGVGVENITWSDKSKMKEGVYKFWINNYDSRRHNGVKAQIEADGVVYDFAYNKHFTGDVAIATVEYSKAKGFVVKSELEVNSSISSKEKWNIKTCTFVRVKKVMLSPNHWKKPVGNKHYMFFLEDCISDEDARPFFNEFLKDEFTQHRKVFEILGSKLRIEHTKDQLSGLGFSETQRNSILCRVTSSFQRVIRINF